VLSLFRDLRHDQRSAFLAAWGGWVLDSMDASLYALVLVPALRELLPRSGYAAGVAEVGRWGGILFSVFMIGWGCSAAFGWLADRIGRTRALMLSIAVYSLFTFLSALAVNVWMLGAFRLIAGCGVGGEWAVGGALVSEVWPESKRRMGAGLLHTGWPVGWFLGAAVQFLVMPQFGWRVTMAVGALPALLLVYIRRNVKESERWEQERRARPQAPRFSEIFAPNLLRATIVSSALMTVCIIGLWAGLMWAPSAVTLLAQRSGFGASAVPRITALAVMGFNLATIAGCLMVPWLAEKWGRKKLLALYFAIGGVTVALGFGIFFHMEGPAALWLFIATLPLMGIGTNADFAVFTLWLPELYPTRLRATGFAFGTSFGRFLGAAGPFVVGTLIMRTNNLGTGVAATALVFVVGLLLIPLARETKGIALQG
jgi:MFS family permease